MEKNYNEDDSSHLKKCVELINNHPDPTTARICHEYSKLVFYDEKFVIKKYRFRDSKTMNSFINDRLSIFEKIWPFGIWVKIKEKERILYVILERLYPDDVNFDIGDHVHGMLQHLFDINELLNDKEKFYTFETWNLGNFIKYQGKHYCVDESKIISVGKPKFVRADKETETEAGFILEKIFYSASRFAKEYIRLYIDQTNKRV